MTSLDLTAMELALIAVTALGAQIVGGIAGYCTGLLMQLVLVPLIGAEAIVPVISLSAVMTNATRVIVFRESLDIPKALLISAVALPTTLLGAYSYTQLSSRGAGLVIGGMLILIVPLRRLLAVWRFRLGPAGGAAAGVVYGFLSGGTTGVGVLLISILMAMGLSGMQVIATDALTSSILGLAKTGLFIVAGELPAKLWVVALIIGGMATPGTFVARWLARRFSARVHDWIIEATILVGGATLVWRSFQSV